MEGRTVRRVAAGSRWAARRGLCRQGTDHPRGGACHLRGGGSRPGGASSFGLASPHTPRTGGADAPAVAREFAPPRAGLAKTRADRQLLTDQPGPCGTAVVTLEESRNSRRGSNAADRAGREARVVREPGTPQAEVDNGQDQKGDPGTCFLPIGLTPAIPARHSSAPPPVTGRRRSYNNLAGAAALLGAAIVRRYDASFPCACDE
jgi:hypothetical protein